MQIFDILVLSTNPLQAFSLYILNREIYLFPCSKKTRELSTYFLYCIFLSLIYLTFKTPISMLVCTIFSIFLTTTNYSGSLVFKGIYSVVVYIFFLVIEVLISLFSGLISLDLTEKVEYNSIFGLLIARTLLLVLVIIFRQSLDLKRNNINFPLQYCLSILIVLLGTLFLYINYLKVIPFAIVSIFVSTVIILTINIIVLSLFSEIYKSLSLKLERDVLQEQTRAYENQTEIIKCASNSIASLRHDMQNHLTMLSELNKFNKNEELENYLLSITGDLEIGATSSGCRTYVRSDNFMVDSIINSKLNELNNLGVEIVVDVKIPTTLNILAFDITVILGNILDNSITALKKDHENKKITIKAKCTKGSLFLFIDNSFDGEIRKDYGEFASTKSNGANAGIGLKNVKTTLLKYEGRLSAEYTDELFSVTILIPFQ